MQTRECPHAGERDVSLTGLARRAQVHVCAVERESLRLVDGERVGEAQRKLDEGGAAFVALVVPDSPKPKAFGSFTRIVIA